MFKFLFNNREDRPEPHSATIDRVVAEFLFDNHLKKPKLEELHAKVPKKYWQHHIQNQKVNYRYVWRNDTWESVEKSELPLFEIIKHDIRDL